MGKSSSKTNTSTFPLLKKSNSVSSLGILSPSTSMNKGSSAFSSSISLRYLFLSSVVSTIAWLIFSSNELFFASTPTIIGRRRVVTTNKTKNLRNLLNLLFCKITS